MSEPPVVPPGSSPPAPPPDPRYPPYTQYPPYAPYPPYPQPGYPPPGYWPASYQVLGYPPPRKDSTRTVYGIIAAVLVAGIVLCVGCGLALSSYDNLVSHSLSGSLASLTVDEFCLDKKRRTTAALTPCYHRICNSSYQRASLPRMASSTTARSEISTCTQQGPGVEQYQYRGDGHSRDNAHVNSHT